MCAAVVLALSATPADGAVVVSGRSDANAVRRVDGWLHGLALRLPQAAISVNLAPCPGLPWVAGCSAPGSVWIRLPAADRAVTLHELGHQFDYTQPSWARAAFARLNRDRRPWGAAPNGPDEQFAEAWMGCAAPALAAARYDSATGRYEFAYAYRPTPTGFARACRLIRRAAAVGARHDVPGAPQATVI